MPTITFDGPNKTITIGYDGPITEVTAEYIYSRWKDWVALGNAQYEPAFAESVGGNELGGGTALSGYYFINNNLGWNLKHDEFNYEIRLSGDLYPADPNAPFIETTLTPHSVQFIFQRSAASYVTVGSGSVPTATQVATAVWNDVNAVSDSSIAAAIAPLIPTVEEVAYAVWEEAMTGHATPDSFGKRLKEILPTLWGIK